MPQMFLHTVCLPSIPGACVDRASDPIFFKKSLERMENATLEVDNRISETVEDLDRWVENLEEQQILEVTNLQDNPDSDVVASRLLAYLVARQPDFHFQVTTSRRGDAWHRGNIWFNGCDKLAEQCTTHRDRSGHIFFLNLYDRHISIRYRLKELGNPDTDINGTPYPKYFQEVVNRSFPRPSSDTCGAGACTLTLICNDQPECSTTRQQYFISTYRSLGQDFDDLVVREATSEGAEHALPKFDVDLVFPPGSFIEGNFASYHYYY